MHYLRAELTYLGQCLVRLFQHASESIFWWASNVDDFYISAYFITLPIADDERDINASVGQRAALLVKDADVIARVYCGDVNHLGCARAHDFSPVVVSRSERVRVMELCECIDLYRCPRLFAVILNNSLLLIFRRQNFEYASD